MTRNLTLACASLLFSIAFNAGAEDLPGQKYDSIVEAEAAAKPDDIICKQEKVTGSHLKKRVCATKSQRAAARKSAQEDLLYRSNNGIPLIPKN